MLDHGKYFYIRSHLNEMVLDVMGGDAAPGVDVKTYPYNGGENQHWHEDKCAGVIRSALDDSLVLHMTDDGLQLAEYVPNDEDQQWRVTGTTISHRDDMERVLDIRAQNSDECAEVIAYAYHGADNQQWDICNLPPRRCIIESGMHGKVLDVKEGDPSPGTKVVLYEKHEGENQQFYEDHHGIIRSCLNDLALDTSDECLRLDEYEEDSYAKQWMKCGDRIVNQFNLGRCLDIKQRKTKDNAKVVEYDANGQDNQQWFFVYLD